MGSYFGPGMPVDLIYIENERGLGVDSAWRFNINCFDLASGHVYHSSIQNQTFMDTVIGISQLIIQNIPVQVVFESVNVGAEVEEWVRQYIERESKACIDKHGIVRYAVLKDVSK